MSTATLIRALDAIISQDSSAHVAPSAPVLTLLTNLAEGGDLKGFSETVTLVRLANPQNTEFVMSTVPAKILNGYLLGHLGLSSANFERWEKSNRAWAEHIKSALPQALVFERTVRNIAEGIRSA